MTLELPMIAESVIATYFVFAAVAISFAITMPRQRNTGPKTRKLKSSLLGSWQNLQS